MSDSTYCRWSEVLVHRGRTHAIPELVEKGVCELCIAGNTYEGWQVFAYEIDGPERIPVSPHFHRDFGDTRADLIAACIRAYGTRPRVTRDSL